MVLKSIVVCLVLANVGYFLWERGFAAPADMGRASVAGAAPATLKLASETPEGAHVADVAGLNATSAGPAVPDSVRDPVREPARDDAGGSGLLKNVKRCISIGPFRDVAETAHAATTLRSGGYDPRQRVADGEVWAGVWVYLPLPTSRPAADQMLAKLKSAGIDDALEMPGPSEGSVISLGLFSEPKRAQSRVVQAQAIGLNPGIADRKRNGNVYWIDIDLKPTDGLLNPSDLQSEAGRITRLEVKGCPSVAAAAQP